MAGLGRARRGKARQGKDKAIKLVTKTCLIAFIKLTKNDRVRAMKQIAFITACALAAVIILALNLVDRADVGRELPGAAKALDPAPTVHPRSTPAPGSVCPAVYHPVAPIGVKVSEVIGSEGIMDISWAKNALYQCAGDTSLACGYPAGDFVGWDIRWSTDSGKEGITEVRPEEGACATLHAALWLPDQRHIVVQVRAVSRVGVSGWSSPAYWPAAGHAVLPLATPTPTLGPTPTPGGPTPTPHPIGREETIWLVAYDPARGTLPGGQIPSLPDVSALTGWQPEDSDHYLEFQSLPHCTGTKRFWIVWPDAWLSPDRYALVSPTGGIAPVLERAWERTLAGVEIRGVDREYWKMIFPWNCTAIAGQHLRIYGGG